jgi:hypothetical protein
MENNLIPPFILREAGWTVNDVPRIHSDCVSQYTHSILLERRNVHIGLHLHGVFSYFTCTKPTQSEFDLADRNMIHWMTPITHAWNPNQDNYAIAEDSYLDWRGQLVPSRDRARVVREDNLLDVSSGEGAWIKSEDESENPNITQRHREHVMHLPDSDSDLTMNGFEAAAVDLLPHFRGAENYIYYDRDDCWRSHLSGLGFDQAGVTTSQMRMASKAMTIVHSDDRHSRRREAQSQRYGWEFNRIDNRSHSIEKRI